MSERNAHEETLQLRVAHLEGSLRRTRLVLRALVPVLALSTLVAWRAKDEIRTSRLVLTPGVDSAAVVLQAAPGASQPGLLLETLDGGRILLLGGDPARLVR